MTLSSLISEIRAHGLSVEGVAQQGQTKNQNLNFNLKLRLLPFREHSAHSEPEARSLYHVFKYLNPISPCELFPDLNVMGPQGRCETSKGIIAEYAALALPQSLSPVFCVEVSALGE